MQRHAVAQAALEQLPQCRQLRRTRRDDQLAEPATGNAALLGIAYSMSRPRQQRAPSGSPADNTGRHESRRSCGWRPPRRRAPRPRAAAPQCRRASAAATARPTTPAPTTTQSTSALSKAQSAALPELPQEVRMRLALAPDVAAPDARLGADVQAAAAVVGGDANDHVVLEAEPEGGGRRLDPAFLRASRRRSPSPARARSASASSKAWLRRERQPQRLDVRVGLALLRGDLLAGVLGGLGASARSGSTSTNCGGFTVSVVMSWIRAASARSCRLFHGTQAVARADHAGPRPARHEPRRVRGMTSKTSASATAARPAKNAQRIIRKPVPNSHQPKRVPGPARAAAGRR
jgi:hypothetical protein